jgi:hypothetical protein
MVGIIFHENMNFDNDINVQPLYCAENISFIVQYIKGSIDVEVPLIV